MNFIAIDIGGTNIKYGVLNHNGEILYTSKLKTSITPTNNFILEDINLIITSILKDYSIEGVAISTAGVVSPSLGEIIYASSNIPNYIGTNFKKHIKEKFNLNCQVENDVNCAALVEMWLGSGKGYSSLFCITIGTGIGGALIIDKKIVPGVSNSAGEVGYLNLGNGEIQKIASTKALVNAISKKSHEKVHGEAIFKKAKEGDALCIEEINKVIENIANLIVTINYVVNPEVFILGGGIMEQEDFIKPILINKIKEKVSYNFIKNTNINFASLGNKAGMVGALYNYLYKNYKQD